MAADYTNTKLAGGADAGLGKQGRLWPENIVTTPWGRLEPLLQPEELKSRFLKGIPMVLKVVDPETKKPVKITDQELKDYIERAVEIAETETSLMLMPGQFTEKLPFSKADYDQFGYWKLAHKPISSIEALNVVLADNNEVFAFPVNWLETGLLITGQLNLIPLAVQTLQGGVDVVGAPGGQLSPASAFFNNLWNRPWVASLFAVTYTAGFPDGMMPKTINELVGTIAAMRVLSMIAAAYAHQNSASLGLDGLSQSVSTPGPQRYAVRMQELKDDRTMLVKKIKRAGGAKIFTGVVGL